MLNFVCIWNVLSSVSENSSEYRNTSKLGTEQHNLRTDRNYVHYVVALRLATRHNMITLSATDRNQFSSLKKKNQDYMHFLLLVFPSYTCQRYTRLDLNFVFRGGGGGKKFNTSGWLLKYYHLLSI